MIKLSKVNFKQSKSKGITLIALVITIIVLLILAGISIATLTGENGILIKSEKAKTETEIADIKEQIKIEILEKQTENLGNITENQLNEILEKYDKDGKSDKVNDSGERIIQTDKGYIIKVSEIFNGSTSKDKNPIFTKVANPPNITGFNKDTTYYVGWNLANSPYQIEESKNLNQIAPSNWYDYTAEVKQWANVKTTGGGNDCYWVWIPRYAYKVPQKSSTEQTIEIKFLEKDSNIPIGESEEITNTIPTPNTWVVHPAFTNEGNGGWGELTGIWVVKFEASSSQVSENTLTQDLNTAGVESMSWDSDYSNFVNLSGPVFVRGGRANQTSGVGIFAFSWNTGRAQTFLTFRPCLI